MRGFLNHYTLKRTFHFCLKMDNPVNQIHTVHSYSIVANESKEIVEETSNGNIIEESVIQCFAESDNCPEETFAGEIVCVSTEKEENADPENNQGKDLLEKKIIEVLSSENVENICFIDNIKQEYTVTELHGALNVTSDEYFQPLTYQDLNLIYTDNCILHVCDICGKGFRKKSNLKRHYRSHTGDNPYACHQCEAHFPTMSRLKEHLHAHTGLRPYVCDICGKTFSRISNLTRHHRTHNSDKPFKCDKCDSRFIELTRLREHYQTHVGEKKFECEVCSKRFLKKYNLKRHFRTHTGEHPHSCDVCGRGFSKKIYMLVHKETHSKSGIGKKKLHNSDDTSAMEADSAIKTVASNCVIECTDLNVALDNDAQLDSKVDLFSEANSQSTNDQEDKIFSCGQCNRHYLKESSLIAHAKRHGEKDPLSCEVCNATFTHASRLKEHFVTHSGEKAYSCAVCKRSFGRNSNLLRHLQTHTGEKRFTCSICNKHLSSARRLDEHFLSHTGDKPHGCNVCNKMFRHKFGLQRHLLTHTGEKPHKCEFCGKRFNRKGRMTVHISKHHKPGDAKFLNRVEPRLMNIIQNLEARLNEPVEEGSSSKGRKRKKRLEQPDELEEVTVQITSSNSLEVDSFHNLRSRSRAKNQKKIPTKSLKEKPKSKFSKKGKNLGKEKTEEKFYNIKTRNSKDKPLTNLTSKSEATPHNVLRSKEGALKRPMESKPTNKCKEVVELTEDTSSHIEIDDLSVYQTQVIGNSLDSFVVKKASL